MNLMCRPGPAPRGSGRGRFSAACRWVARPGVWGRHAPVGPTRAAPHPRWRRGRASSREAAAPAASGYRLGCVGIRPGIQPRRHRGGHRRISIRGIAGPLTQKGFPYQPRFPLEVDRVTVAAYRSVRVRRWSRAVAGFQVGPSHGPWLRIGEPLSTSIVRRAGARHQR